MKQSILLCKYTDYVYFLFSKSNSQLLIVLFHTKCRYIYFIHTLLSYNRPQELMKFLIYFHSYWPANTFTLFRVLRQQQSRSQFCLWCCQTQFWAEMIAGFGVIMKPMLFNVQGQYLLRWIDLTILLEIVLSWGKRAPCSHWFESITLNCCTV